MREKGEVPGFFHWAVVQQKTVLGFVFHGCSLQERPGVGVEPRMGSTGGKDVHAAHHQLQIQTPPIFLMELGGAWSSRNEGNLLHFLCQPARKNPELRFG